jgi:septal ring factor EnvC (AmiA/AmiB activator)
MDFEEFYAERVAQFERERRIFREYAALVTPDRKESHNLEWENKKLDNTASEIKIEVDRHAKEAKLLETQIHATMEELNSLKSAKEARNLQIQRLCKLSNPVQRDVTYLVEERFNLRSTRDSEARSGDIILGTVPAGYKPMKTGEVIKLESRLQSET